MSELQEWIGRTSRSAAFLDPAQANRMAALLDRKPTFVEGSELPPAWHWLYFHDVVAASELGDEGHPRLGIVMPPVPLPRRMWAGGRFLFHAPLLLGRPAERSSRIASIREKAGRTGPLYFVTVEHVLTQDGQDRLREWQTIVYRDMAGAGRRAPENAPEHASSSREWQLDSVALFRYSALTFNGHRIHYAADYAREVEEYPGVVIHGPLLVTLLFDLAQEPGRPLLRFEYEARSPLFLPHPFTVNVSRGTSADELALWAAGHHGGLAMTAQAALGG